MMRMSNSPLVDLTILSPNHSGLRTQKISKIAIHHMAGNMSIEACGRLFQDPDREVSANYGIGSDGRIALYVEEKNRAWTTASAWCDNQAITIEVANDAGEPGWHVSDEALESLINLCVDICKRHCIKSCTYTGDKRGTLQMHKWYMATRCPGEYLSSKFSYIAAEVNKRLLKDAEVKSLTPKASIKVESKGLSQKKAFTVRVRYTDLHIRTGAGTNYPISAYQRFIPVGVYTIVETKAGQGSKLGWGRLKSGAGWIALDWVERI